MELKYRIGTLEDKEKLQKLGLDSYGQFKEILTKENWEKMNSFLTTENSYSDLLSKSKCFVSEIKDEIIGMAYLVPKGNLFDRLGISFLYYFTVKFKYHILIYGPILLFIVMNLIK